MDRIFFQTSWAGVKGFTLYYRGKYADAAMSYRTHFKEYGQLFNRTKDSGGGAIRRGYSDKSIASRELGAGSRTIPSLLTLGEGALWDNNLEGAQEYVHQVLRQDHYHPDGLVLSSLISARSGSHQKAIDTLHMLFRDGRMASRTSIFVTVLKIIGELSTVHRDQRSLTLLALYHHYLSFFDPSNESLAMDYASQAIVAGDRPSDAYITIGIVSLHKGKIRTALQAFLDSITADSHNPLSYWWAAKIYSQRGDLSNEFIMQKAAAENAKGDFFYISNAMGTILEKVGDGHSTLRLLKPLVGVEQDDPRVYEWLAQAYFLTGDYSEAVIHYTTVLSMNPKDFSLYDKLSDIYFKQRDFPMAVAILQQASDIDLSRPQPYEKLADLYFLHNQFSDAVREWEMAITKWKGRVRWYANLCLAYRGIMKYQQSVDCFRRMLKTYPNHQMALRNLPEVLKILEIQNKAL